MAEKSKEISGTTNNHEYISKMQPIVMRGTRENTNNVFANRRQMANDSATVKNATLRIAATRCRVVLLCVCENHKILVIDPHAIFNF